MTLADHSGVAPEHGLTLGRRTEDRAAASERCLHDLVEAQVDRTPGAIAVLFGDHALTYRELDEHANQLAHHLRSLGVGPEVPVAICVERSFELVVGVLAICKAGGVCVPLDPGHPVERIAFMLDDSRASVLLVRGRSRAAALAGGCTSVDLDDRSAIARWPVGRVPRRGTPDNALTMFYTSGSTGTPKGSIGHGRGILNLCEWYLRAADIDARSRVLVMTPFTFDASFKNVVTPLVAGGAVVLAEPGFDVRQLLGVIERHAVTSTFTTPTMLYPLLDEAARRDYAALASLETLFVGGEGMHASRLRAWIASASCRCRLMHIYGPSECSDVSAIYMPIADEIRRLDALPLGRAVANAELYVLDESLELVPLGVAGELCIGGLPVGRGYANRPALTAEKFVPNPFRPGERLYRSGDRARWLPSGDVEFLGRMDAQVKIRGVRIEPSEVEAALVRHPLVREAAVLARESAPGAKELVAYVTTRGEVPSMAAALRRHLRTSLPDPMIPSAFVVLDTLPISTNGKVDYAALPPPQRDGVANAPRSDVERRMADVWCAVLGLPEVDVEADFFDLGGHSIAAAELVVRVQDELGAAFQLRDLVEAPTVRALCLRLDAGRRAVIHRGPSDGTVDVWPTSIAQRRLFVVHDMDRSGIALNVGAAVVIRTPYSRDRLVEALRRLVERHESLRTSFEYDARGLVQRVHCAQPVIPDEVRDTTDVTRVLRLLCRPFQLDVAPLMRVAVVPDGDTFVVVLDLHHIVADGISLRILERDLIALYFDEPLPPVAVPYRDYAAWHDAIVQASATNGTRDYWQRTLVDAPAPISWPAGAERGTGAAMVERELPRRLTDHVEHLVDGGVSLLACLGAFFSLAGRACWGADEIVFGTALSGRDHPDLRDVVGAFATVVPVRAHVGADDTLADLFARIRNTTLEAQAHQHVELETLFPSRAIGSRRGLYNVGFSLQTMDTVASGPFMPASRASRVDVEPAHPPAFLDLNLEVYERGDRLLGRLLYRREALDEATAYDFLQGMEHAIARSMICGTDRPIRSWEMY